MARIAPIDASNPPAASGRMLDRCSSNLLNLSPVSFPASGCCGNDLARHGP